MIKPANAFIYSGFSFYKASAPKPLLALWQPQPCCVAAQAFGRRLLHKAGSSSTAKVQKTLLEPISVGE